MSKWIITAQRRWDCEFLSTQDACSFRPQHRPQDEWPSHGQPRASQFSISGGKNPVSYLQAVTALDKLDSYVPLADVASRIALQESGFCCLQRQELRQRFGSFALWRERRVEHLCQEISKPRDRELQASRRFARHLKPGAKELGNSFWRRHSSQLSSESNTGWNLNQLEG